MRFTTWDSFYPALKQNVSDMGGHSLRVTEEKAKKGCEGGKGGGANGSTPNWEIPSTGKISSLASKWRSLGRS